MWDAAMTLSLPPIANGIMLITDVPAGRGSDFPRYTQVQSLDQAASADGEFGSSQPWMGANYTITAETRLLPYLTKKYRLRGRPHRGNRDPRSGHAADDAAIEQRRSSMFQGENGYAK